MNTISAFVGFLLSLALSFVPGMKDWFEKFTPIQKALIFAGLCLLGAAGAAIYEATHGGDFFSVFLSLAQTFISAWVVGTVTNIPVSKIIKERRLQSICNCPQE